MSDQSAAPSISSIQLLLTSLLQGSFETSSLASRVQSNLIGHASTRASRSLAVISIQATTIPRIKQDTDAQQRAMAQDATDAHDLENDLDVGGREERLLMRQRGAGNRQINNIDFNFAFATPSTVRGQRSRSRSNTPGSVTLPSRKQTPTNKKNDLPRILLSTKTNRSNRSERADASDPGSRKRRRLSDISNLQHVSSPRMSDAALRSIIEEELQRSAPRNVPRSASRRSFVSVRSIEEPSKPSSSPMFFSENYDSEIEPEKVLEIDQVEEPELDEEDRSQTSSTGKKPAKRRKRKSVGQQSLFKKKRKSSSVQPLPTPSDTQEDTAESSQHFTIPPVIPNPRLRRWSVASSVPIEQADVTTQPEQTVDPELESESQTREPSVTSSVLSRKRKRKSVVLGKTKRKSSVQPVPTPSQVVQSIEIDETGPSIEDEDEAEEPNELSLQLDPIPPQSPAKRLSIKRLPRVRADSEDDITHEIDDEDHTYMTNDTPDPTPAPKRKKTGRRQYPSSRPKTSIARQSSSYPILTHRLTNTNTLPTIDEELEEDSMNITTRTAPNAADVISQTAREVIDAELHKLKQSDLTTADFNKRVTALTAFRDTLDERFFELSQTLDQRTTLEARLRKSRREKIALQNEWLELRRQRDALDLKKDAIRKRHWENEVLARKRFEASEAAFAVEVAGDEPGQFDGLESDLRQTAAIVSSRNDGGILNTVKNFNAILEALLEELG